MICQLAPAFRTGNYSEQFLIKHLYLTATILHPDVVSWDVKNKSSGLAIQPTKFLKGIGNKFSIVCG